MNAMRSKIGRLPWDVRNELNLKLLDGATGNEAMKWVNAHPAYISLGEAPVSAQNISDWRSTGFERWLKARKETDEIERLAEVAKTIADRAGGSLTAVGQRLLMSHVLDVLKAARDAKQDLDDAAIERLTKAVSALAKNENDAARLALDTQRHDLAVQNLALNRERFEVALCEKLIEAYGNEKIREIATRGDLDLTAKIALLRKHLYSDIEEGAKA